jgi:hypothetical protein
MKFLSLPHSYFSIKNMIQRIQSIYLLLASGAFGSLFALPLLTTTASDTATSIPQLADGRLNVFDNIGLIGLSGLGVALAFTAIFLYKNRNLQGRITGISLVISVLLLVLAAFTAQTVRSAVPPTGNVQFGLGWVAPVAGVILLWLAGKGIKKDEKLVKSMDRLR